MSVSKKQLILDAALVLFVDNGIDGTSTASIAKKANVANGTLFHHFQTKADLVHALYLMIKEQFAQQISPNNANGNSIEQLASNVWNDAIEWSVANPNKLQFFKLVIHSHILSATIRREIMNQQLGFLEQLIIAGQQQGIFAQYPLDLILDNCQGQFLSVSSFFIERPQLTGDIKYREAAFKMFWNTLG